MLRHSFLRFDHNDIKPTIPLTFDHKLTYHSEPRCNMELPYSSYSALVAHMFLNVAKLARMLPPTHALSLLSGGAEIRILVRSGALLLTS